MEKSKTHSAIHFSRAHLFIVVECKVIIISFMQSSTKVVKVNNERPAENWSSLGKGGNYYYLLRQLKCIFSARNIFPVNF